MWNSFAGYRDIYGKSPPAHLVHRVRLWLIAKSEHESEENAKTKQEQEEHRREMERLKNKKH